MKLGVKVGYLMIREITQAQAIGQTNTLLKTKSVKNRENITAPKMQLSKYSAANAKANFMSTGASISFRGAQNLPALNAQWGDVDAGMQNIMALPEYKIGKAHYYDELANDVAVLIGPNKNALLAHEEGVSTELMVHNFARNVMDKKYVNDGFDPRTTDVILFDPIKARANGSAFEQLRKIASQEPQRKKVVFVENFHQFMLMMTMAGNSPKQALKEGVFRNTHIVGLMPKDLYNAIKEGQVPTIPAEDIKPLGKVDFDGLNAADTKDLLKKDGKYVQRILNRYKDKKIKLSPNAIDEIVDKTAASMDGVFPEKAERAIDLTVSSKLTDLTKHKPGTVLTVTSADVKRFFENHTSIVDGMKPTQGQFSLAENVKTKLSDVGGISTLKEEINDDIVSYLKDPKKFAASGRVVPNGKLLTGPPGNGKTLLARAIAGETGVPFIAASGSEFVEKYVGVGAQRVRELFANARKAAAASEKKIAIVFIDEIDAFAKARGAGGSGGDSESEKTLNQLLTEMDGFNKSSKVKVLVLAATNRKDIIDPALLRYGRFDGGIEVTAPKTHADRVEILNIHARGKKFATEADKVNIINNAAKMTEGMSGADLAGVMARAAKVVSKRPDNQVMTYNDMVEGYLQVIAGPVKTSDSSPATKKMVVRHEAGHAVLIDTLKQDKVSFITLDGRGDFLGAVFHGENKEMPNFKSVIYSAATSYAGGHAEPGFESAGHSAGVSGDLKNATKLIDKAIKKWGLGVNTPQISIGDTPSEQGNSLLKMYEPEIKKDINLFTKTAQTISKKVVAFHKEFLDEYVNKFEQNAGKGGNNLSGEEFSKMREDWITRTGKTKQYKALQKEIEKIVDVAQNGKVSLLKRALKLIRR